MPVWEVSFKRKGRARQVVRIKSKAKKDDYVKSLRAVGIRPTVKVIKTGKKSTPKALDRERQRHTDLLESMI